MSLPQSSHFANSNRPADSLASLPQVVINTRPIERAAPLTVHLEAAGLTVVDIPMLALQPRAITDKDMTLMRQWFAGDYQALVIVSPTAAASGLAIWQALESESKANDNNHAQYYNDAFDDNVIEDNKNQNESIADPYYKSDSSDAPSHLIAVGEATAAVLQNTKLQAAKNYQVLQPAVANNEGMLVMPEIETLQAGDKLLVWRGLGGRRLLVDTLQARGVHIDSIAWYERVMPAIANEQYRQWLAQFTLQNVMQSLASSQLLKPPKPIVIISSGTAFEHWTSIVEQRPVIDTELKPDNDLHTDVNDMASLKLSDFAYVVLGVRLAHMVAERQLSYWRVEDLAPETILAAIQQNDEPL